jgi:hypothetical protein
MTLQSMVCAAETVVWKSLIGRGDSSLTCCFVQLDPGESKVDYKKYSSLRLRLLVLSIQLENSRNQAFGRNKMNSLRRRKDDHPINYVKMPSNRKKNRRAAAAVQKRAFEAERTHAVEKYHCATILYPLQKVSRFWTSAPGCL